MGLADVAASIDGHARDIVESQTWGHLAPEPGKMYRGTVMFACGSYSGATAFLSINFKALDGTPLHDNPWSYEDITDYIVQWICDQANGYYGRNPIPTGERFETDGKVFSFNGSYTRFKNNNCRIVGNFQSRQIV